MRKSDKAVLAVLGGVIMSVMVAAVINLNRTPQLRVLGPPGTQVMIMRAPGGGYVQDAEIDSTGSVQVEIDRGRYFVDCINVTNLFSTQKVGHAVNKGVKEVQCR